MTLEEIDTSRPHPARMYDYYLGGKDYYPIDEQAAERVISLVPEVKKGARINRQFMHRAVRLLAEQGIRQFLDIGTGIPTEPNLHQVAQRVDPSARVMYVDNDPIVLRHAEALLRSTPEGLTRYVQADVRDPGKITSAAQEFFDFERPIALSMVALLHFVSDEHDPYGLVNTLLAPLPAGSCVVLSHVTGDFDPEGWANAVQIYRESGVPAQVRSRDEFARFFNGLELIEPGVQVATDWHPDSNEQSDGDSRVSLYAGVARK
ncbi:SAM-dependent methyltransferase [Streptomyces sp. NPDC004237]|uniref:SAM-dependent methyltransferase n=1 Tax=Streptomyces sp. NPDC004237 TaxID=3154455 RepID=UPI0033ABAFE6